MAAAAAAAAAELSKKPHFVFPEKAPNMQQTPSKSSSNSLCKTLIILVFLLVIPLFPSQAPDFISQSIFTEFLEIVHLLFIGIVVSYGLFSRKTAQMVPEKSVNSTNDDSNAYLSGISHLSSIFEDGFENLCGPDEQDMMQSDANYHYLQKSSDHYLHGGTKFRSLLSNDGKGNICEGNGKMVNQSWCSQYLKGESLVVVSNGKYFLGESSDFKPLNLPVRSLRSRVVENDKPELNNRHESSPVFEGMSNAAAKVIKIRGVVPMNLEKKLNEVAGSSSIPWRSRSGRMENGEEMSNPKAYVHCRPHSVGDFEFEHLKSRSLRSSKFSSSPELASSGVKNGDGEKVFPVSHPKGAPLNVEASFCGVNWETQPCSVGDSSGMNRLENLENNSKNYCSHCEEDKGKQAIEIESLESNAKAISRAKSVRTIKTSRYIMNEKERYSSQIDGKLGRMLSKSEAVPLVKRRRGEDEPENHPVNDQNQKHNRIFFPTPKPKPTLSEVPDEEKEDADDQSATVSEEDSESDFEKISHQDDARTNISNDSELEGSEVDRKAGEFIAKFREQIRLQKMSSAEGNSGW